MGELVLFERLKKREYSVFLDDVPVFYKENLRDAITSFSPHSTAFCPFSEQFGFMLLRSRQALYCTRLALKYSSRSFQNSPGLLPSFGWLLVNTTKNSFSIYFLLHYHYHIFRSVWGLSHILRAC